MKLSDVDTLMRLKDELDFVSTQIARLTNDYYDLRIVLGDSTSVGGETCLTIDKSHRAKEIIKSGVDTCLKKYRDELVTELTLYGVTDFNK